MGGKHWFEGGKQPECPSLLASCEHTGAVGWISSISCVQILLNMAWIHWGFGKSVKACTCMIPCSFQFCESFSFLKKSYYSIRSIPAELMEAQPQPSAGCCPVIFLKPFFPLRCFQVEVFLYLCFQRKMLEGGKLPHGILLPWFLYCYSFPDLICPDLLIKKVRESKRTFCQPEGMVQRSPAKPLAGANFPSSAPHGHHFSWIFCLFLLLL